MASTINLLPAEFTPSGSAVKLAKLVNNLVFIGVTVFLLVVAGTVSFFLINYFSINDSAKRQETLKASIKSLETTETRMVLVQDRLIIAKKLLTRDSAINDITALAKLLPNTGTSVFLTEADISPEKSQFSVISGSSLELAKFLAAVTAGDTYKNVTLIAFSYNPTAGFLSTFKTEAK